MPTDSSPLEAASDGLPPSLPAPRRYHGLTARSAAVTAVFARIEALRGSSAPVLVLGEPAPAASWWPVPSTPPRRGAEAPSSPCTAPPSPRASPTASCSATPPAPSPAPRGTTPGVSRRRPEAPSTWPTSAPCRRRSRSACWRSSGGAGSAASATPCAAPSRSAWWPATGSRRHPRRRAACRRRLHRWLRQNLLRLPALRYRPEDVEPLAAAFLARVSRRDGVEWKLRCRDPRRPAAPPLAGQRPRAGERPRARLRRRHPTLAAPGRPPRRPAVRRQRARPLGATSTRRHRPGHTPEQP